MTSVNSTSAIDGGAAARSGVVQSAAATDAAEQFETFLKMLTTQISNQDPLNPMEGTDFAVQLATFSGVEQQVQTNLLLAQLLDDANGGDLGRFSDWIGREIRTSSPVWFDGSPLTVATGEVADADSLTLVVLDESGREVLRENLDPAAQEVEWQGHWTSGETVPPGLYSFRIEATRNGELASVSDAESYGRVTGVGLTEQGPELMLAGGGRVLVDEVSALRE